MTGPTHLAFGLFSAVSSMAVVAVPLHSDLAALAAAALGSQLPGVDIPRSAIGLLLQPLSTQIERRWGHRNLTHGLVALAVLAD